MEATPALSNAVTSKELVPKAPPRDHQSIPWALTHNPLRFRQLIDNPYAFMRDSVAKYGPIYKIHGPGGEQIILNHPDAARTLFALPPDHTMSFGNDIFAPFLGEQNILGMSGERHKQERKLLMPHFHGQRMRTYADVIQQVSREQLAKIPLNQPFALQKVTQAISLEVIIRAVFGLQSTEKVGEAVKAVVGLVESMTAPLVFFPAIRRNFFGMGPWARFQKNKKALDSLLEAEIDRRRAHQELGDDILSLLVASQYEDGTPMDKNHIRDELNTLLFAGHETTAVMLAWTFFWLHKVPSTLEKLRAELKTAGPNATAEALSKLPYLEAICNETLRMYPIVPVTMRQLKVPVDVLGYQLPVGAKVAIGTGWVHMDPATYPEPETFRPERFLERTYGPHEFLPFGGGNRRCLGAAFAQYEMKLVIAQLLGGAEFRLTTNTPPRFERRNAIVGPKGGVEMVRVA